MSLLSFLRRDEPTLPAGPSDPHWQRDKRGYFHRLMWLRPAEHRLTGVGGVFVIWHRGVRPEWVFVGASDDLGAAIATARDEPEISRYEMNGGLYVTWAPILSEFRNGVVAYLHEKLEPVADIAVAGVVIDTDAKQIPVLPPK